jgi:hypothetical protein
MQKDFEGSFPDSFVHICAHDTQELNSGIVTIRQFPLLMIVHCYELTALVPELIYFRTDLWYDRPTHEIQTMAGCKSAIVPFRIPR